jgi:hypothetical protein
MCLKSLSGMVVGWLGGGVVFGVVVIQLITLSTPTGVEVELGWNISPWGHNPVVGNKSISPWGHNPEVGNRSISP